MREQWDPSEVAEFGKTDLDLWPFQLAYLDLAAHLAESALRAEFDQQRIYVAPGQRSLTNKFATEALLALDKTSAAFFQRHKPILGWWQSGYIGAQLWAHSNGVADTKAVVRLPERLGGDRGIFSTLAALHHSEPQAQAAYAQARSEFIAAAGSTHGWTLYVNEQGLIDVRR